MNERVTNAVTRCLEIDVDFYRELLVFLMKKHAKIMTDDLEWLTESLNKEQAYLMKSKSLEEKREELFRGLGLQKTHGACRGGTRGLQGKDEFAYKSTYGAA